MFNTLHYGDNLDRLRNHVPDESVDLVYLDPPFSSSRTFNLLFKQQKGDASPAQIMAFEDTWKWSKAEYDAFFADPRNRSLFDIVNALFLILGRSEMMAYILMMGPRLLELHRVLKPTGSFYLHCDHTAGAYLRLLLDSIFGPQNCRNHITWKRTSAHNDAKRKFGDVCDLLLYYTKSDEYTFNVQYAPHDESYLRDFYRYTDANGRRFRLGDLSSPSPRPNLTYEYKGYIPPVNGWRVSRERMEHLDAEGRLHFPKSQTGRIQLKRFLDEMPGTPVPNIWDDIRPVQSQSKERRGYPTQKPLTLLERIIATSTNEGDVVLDPFAGCGTAVIQSERMKRRWIGIDITYLAIAEVIYRLGAETQAKRNVTYQVKGCPTDKDSARALWEVSQKQSRKPFEIWAVSLVEGEPIEKKGGDRGIDGRLPLFDPEGVLRWGMIQVKGGGVTPGHVRDFAQVIHREKALLGLFLTLQPPTPQMLDEAQEMGVLEGFGTRKIPRLQIWTIKQLLEEKKLPEIPAGYRPLRDPGVGLPLPAQGELAYPVDLPAYKGKKPPESHMPPLF